MRTVIITTALTLWASTGQASIDEIELHCAFPNHESYILELDRWRVVRDGEDAKAENIVVTNHFISFVTPFTRTNNPWQWKIDRLSGDAQFQFFNSDESANVTKGKCRAFNPNSPSLY